MALLDRIKGLKLNRGLTCESCGNDFVCEVGLGGCWCMEVKLSDETRRTLKDRYKSCLCRTCLEQAEQLQAADPHV